MVIEIIVLEKIFWSGVAAVGFGILFNIPKRIILPVFFLGGLAGFLKFTALANDTGIVLSSLVAASAVGFGSIPFAHKKHTSPFLLSIPSIIPMIPGYFGYKMLLGIMQLAIYNNPETDITTLMSVIHNGLNMMFILLSLSIGVSLPWLIFREKGLRKIKLAGKDDLV